MPGHLVHLGATVLCTHGGQAQPTAPSPRVRVQGQPAVVQTTPYVVAGCAFVPPTGNGPCVSAQWIKAATRVLLGGVPAVLQDSRAVCVPTGTPLTVVTTQLRVRGT